MPVAEAVPFDNGTSKGFIDDNVQRALEELREHTIYDSRTQATTLNGTLTLTVTDKNFQILTGTQTGYSVVLPSATTLTLSASYQIANTSSQPVTIKDGSGAALFTLSQGSIGYAILQLNGTTAGTWLWWQSQLSVASGVITYNITTPTVFTSSSTTDVVITGFTVTPLAGTYAVWFNIATENTSGTATNTASIYKAGVKIADSERAARMAASNSPFALASMTISSFNGSETCDVRVRTSSASQTVRARSLLLIRLGA